MGSTTKRPRSGAPWAVGVFRPAVATQAEWTWHPHRLWKQFLHALPSPSPELHSRSLSRGRIFHGRRGLGTGQGRLQGVADYTRTRLFQPCSQENGRWACHGRGGHARPHPQTAERLPRLPQGRGTPGPAGSARTWVWGLLTLFRLRTPSPLGLHPRSQPGSQHPKGSSEEDLGSKGPRICVLLLKHNGKQQIRIWGPLLPLETAGATPRSHQGARTPKPALPCVPGPAQPAREPSGSAFFLFPSEAPDRRRRDDEREHLYILPG